MSGAVERSEFIGGLRWRVPAPAPVVSECAALVASALSGDKEARKRCEGLYVKSRRPTRKPAARPVKKKPAKAKRKLRRS